MAAARCLRWGLNRAEAWVLPPPARCCHRAPHRQLEGTEFRSAYSLDKLYPESRGADTAWRVPVSQDGRPEGAFPGRRRGAMAPRARRAAGPGADAFKRCACREPRPVALAAAGLGRMAAPGVA